MAAHEYALLFVVLRDSLWLIMSVRGSSWSFVAARRCSLLIVTVHGSTLLLVALRCCSLLVVSGCGCLWQVVTAWLFAAVRRGCLRIFVAFRGSS